MLYHVIVIVRRGSHSAASYFSKQPETEGNQQNLLRDEVELRVPEAFRVAVHQVWRGGDGE